MKKVEAWSAEDVSDWLNKEGMPEYIKVLHQTDGPALLSLTKADFTVPPLSRMSPDGGERLLERIEILQIETHIEDHKNGHANGHIGGIPNGTSKLQRNGTLGKKDFETKIRIPIPTVEPPRSSFPTEWGKTGIAFIYAIICFVTTTVVISVVHERVPPKEHTPPLPDKFFDLFDRREWAFSICEINGMLLVGLWLIQWILLKHRFPQALLVLPLVLPSTERFWDFLHPSGPRPLHCGCGRGILHHYTPLLVVPHHGQPAVAEEDLTEQPVVTGVVVQTLPVFRRERERYGSPELPAASFGTSVSLEPCREVQPTGHPVTPVELKQARTVT
ncbi:phosphatidylcholine:ceramide cholinephosphotransferase 1-like isoform X2 [Girardinichthys multiradiatus]|uniref:phosphatidylcholine:ceramide cholinephosphotransferase 1-like isoform X2 n=1 Tax=Girardinichthys multiradiatus TaxID=208333 RepID=UPI001FAC7D0C|nr:phosphatidylcholine:ceramide cholinephosphotransferase 1-like isoform X2 [Girardinichthys multiradiatus]